MGLGFYGFVLTLSTLCLILFTLALRGVSGSTHGHTLQKKNAVIDAPPVIKMYKRVIRQFRTGRTAKVTLIFHASRDINIRWFRKARGQEFDGSEINGFMPLLGDPAYRHRVISAGPVFAYTLNILNFSESIELETVISMADGTLQYNLRTEVNSRQDEQVIEQIDSPEWTILPDPDGLIQNDEEEWEFKCEAFVLNEFLENDVNPLNKFNKMMLRRYSFEVGDPSQDATASFTLTLDGDPVNDTTIREQSIDNPLLFVGQRRVHYEHAFYEMSLTAPNSSSEDKEGIYQCYFSREPGTGYLDMLYSLGQEREQNDYHDIHMLEMKACSSNQWNEGTLRLVIDSGEPACIRCRGRDSRDSDPDLYLSYENGSATPMRAEEFDGVFVHRYVNVAEVGIHETLYVFRNPSKSLMNGTLACKMMSKNQQYDDNRGKEGAGLWTTPPFKIEIKT